MARPLWFIDLLKRSFAFRNIGAKMTNLPILGQVMERALFNGHRTGDALFYLPKDNVVINQKIDEVENIVLPSKVVEHFINESNYIFLMNECICRSAENCQDYDHDIGCIFLGEAVLEINPKLGKLVDRGTALKHVAKARDAGLIHLIGRDKIDSVWMGAAPSTKLMTICNCCPCCCLFRFLPHLAPKLQKKIERMPYVNVEVTEDCIGCGVCTEGVCFIDAISLVDGKAVISEDCRGCGHCAEVCPDEAIKVIIVREDYIDNAITRLSQAVDVH